MSKQARRTRWMISLVMAFVMLFPTVGTAFAAESIDSESRPAMTSEVNIPTYGQVYNCLIGLQEDYPEGITWSAFEPYSLADPYIWKGGRITEKNINGGAGCAAFAFILSDAAFGQLPARSYNNGAFTFNDVKIGDILDIKTDGSPFGNHVVIVLAKSAYGVILAEGNYNKSVHWGRVLSAETVNRDTIHLITRYPEGYSEELGAAADKPMVVDGVETTGSIGSLTWTLTNARTLTISGSGSIPDFSLTDDNLPPWSAYNDYINMIVIGDGVTSIGDYTFYQTSKAYSAYIPDGVTSIGRSAFRESGMIAVSIPSSVKAIGDDAFHDCTSLISATVPEGVRTIGERAFMSCTSLEYIDFPASITSVGAGAFAECTQMTRVRFVPGGGQVTMGDNLFSRCWKLTSVLLPDGADCISGGMFTSCISLASLDIPASVTEIKSHVTGSSSPFAGCDSLTTINFGGSKEQWNETNGPAILTYSGLASKVTVNFDVVFDNPFAKDPNEPDNLFCDPSGEEPPAIPEHEHEWTETWSYNDAHHWHECEAESCPIVNNGEKDGYAKHNYVGDTCACGYKHEHVWDEGWTNDRTHHWHECTVAGCPIASNSEKSGYAEHTYEKLVTSTKEIVEMVVALAADAEGGDGVELASGAENLVPDGEEDILESGEKNSIGEDDIPPDDGEEDGGEYELSTDAEDENNPAAGLDEGGNSGANTDVGTVTDPEAGTGLEPNPGTEPQPETEPEITVSTVCSTCGYDSTQPLPDPPAHQHIWSEAWSHDATNHWHQCDDCTEITDNAAHGYGDWVISVAATATQNGSKYRECTICKYRQTESISATGSSSSTNPSYPSYPNYPSNSGTSSNISPNTTTTTTRNPDGSTTTTVTNKSTGTTTETTKNPDGSQIIVETQKDSTVTTTKTDQIGNKTTIVAKPDGSNTVAVSQKDGTTATSTTDATGKVTAEVKLSTTVINTAQQRGEAVSLPIPAVRAAWNVENAPVITVSTGSDKPVKVTIPTVNPAPSTVAVIVHPNGLTEVVKTSVPTSDGIVTPVSDGATVKVIDNSKSFADVPAGNWAENAITFVAARELFAGTSATTFVPEQPMTRAMLMTVLARFDGAETSGGATWYDKGMEWAMVHGVSDGTNPSSNITREQLVTMLWRYMGSPTATGTLLEFTDANQTNGYAEEAMRWAVENGLVSGFGDGRLGPQGQATRAQVAQILQNLIKNMTLSR